MFNPLARVNITIRAAQQVYDKTGGYCFKGLRVVVIGSVKNFDPGTVKKGDAMGASVTLELTYIKIEVDGQTMVEIDKVNGQYVANNQDMLAGIKELV